MNTCKLARAMPWRRVLACAVAWLVLWPLSLVQAQCPPVVPPPGFLPEMEPNNTMATAQNWPFGPTIYGEQSLMPGGDNDYFRLTGVPTGAGILFTVTPDTFNPRIRIWGQVGPTWTLLADRDEHGWCEAETFHYGGPDPCISYLPVTQYMLCVSPSLSGPPMYGHYLAGAALVTTVVPVGDCCQYPIEAAPPFEDTRDSSAGYRDMGLGPGPDVWYRVTLPEGGTMLAQTCNGDSFFDTMLWLLAADCETVLASNDNSEMCSDPSKSYLEQTLDPGVYYVVVEGSPAGGGGAGWYTLELYLGGCPPVMPPPGALWELEPNDDWHMAQPWPVTMQLYGEQTTTGDADWFLLESAGDLGEYSVTIQPDTFDPVVTAYVLTDLGVVPVATANNAGFCESEQLTFYIDPCAPFHIIGGPYVSVTQNDVGVPMHGHYIGSFSVGPNPIPVGDCCQYPISVGAFPYNDSQNTSVSFRDQGFNVSADVWYQLVLDQGGILMAETCGAATNYNTMLWLVDDDCETVLDSNDDSNLCGMGSTKSRFSKALAAGTYYVVVEGSGAAEGTFALHMTFTTCNPVMPGPGALWELEPNNGWRTAQPWPVTMQLYGEQTTMGDADWYRQVPGGIDIGECTVTIQPDTFDPVVTVWVLTTNGIVPVATANEGGFCESEQLTFYIDPCAPFQIVDGPFISVTQNDVGMPMQGHYLGSFIVGPNPIPVGDCCQYPISVGAFPYNDSQNTSVSFRDQGFNASADVWYQLVLDQGGILMAETCGAATNYNTMLWLVDDDCETVLDSNDDSNLCGPGSTKSRFSKALTAGTYYVVVEGNGAAEGTFALHMTFTTCNPVMPEPGALWELEPNDHWTMAQPWPMSMQLYGEQTTTGDADWFVLMGAQSGDEVTVTLEPDTFNPRMAAYVLTPTGIVPVAEVDNGGFCEGEVLTFYIDPCAPFVWGGPVYIEVTQSPTGMPTSGHYLGGITVGPNPIPVGDCCSYPINVGAFPYTDTRNSSVSFRDKGFGPSPDVWYKIVLDGGGVLTAQTCGGQTNYNTMLWLVDDDCETVLASNNDSNVCGAGSTQSWLSTCLAAGTYYVVVEGSDNASGTFTLNLALRLNGENACLVAGEWGRLAEEWNRHYTPSTSFLRLLADDVCGQVGHVAFYGGPPETPPALLGVDWDGWEPAVATQHVPEPWGDGWFCDFEPSMVRSDPGPAYFYVDIFYEDGSVRQVATESWYSPLLEEESLIAPLEYWEVIHDDHFTLVPAPGPIPLNMSLGYKLGEKVPEWSRDVPEEWQRPVSDTHCVPTAIAACLEWLDETYGTNVTGGLSGEELIGALGGYMGTNVNQPGTTVSDATNGLQDWIDDHGGGYTVHTDQHGDTEGMQEEGEGQQQDVIVILWWAGGGGHAVTLSSFKNVPNENGTVTVDFMDPWTGTTQEGEFDPETGTFSGYGDNNDSGQLGQVIYVCPVQDEPGGGGGGGGGGGWVPWNGLPVDIPVLPGLWWLKMTFLDPDGKAVDLWNIVERRAAENPVVFIQLVNNAQTVHLHWEAIDDAIAYEVYRWPAGFAPPTGALPWQTTTNTWVLDLVPPSGHWFYYVKTVYAQ